MYSLSIILNLLLFILILLVLLAFGSRVLKFFNFSAGLALIFLFSFGLGYGIFGYLLYLIGLAHLFYFWLIWILLILAAVFSYREIIFWLKHLKVFWARLSFSKLAKNKLGVILVLILSVYLFFVLIGTVSPMVEFDSRWYHFAEPKYYLEHHLVVIKAIWTGTEFPPSVLAASGFPRLAEMFFAIFLSFKAEIAAKLTNLLFGLIGVLAIFLFTKRKAGRLAGFVAASAILFSAVFVMDATYGYIDLITFGLAALSFLAFFLYLETEAKKYLLIAGVLTGLAVSTKHNGLFLVPIFSFLALVWNLLAKKGWLKSFKATLLYALASLLFCFSWYIDTRIHTGHFFYPFVTDTARDIRAQTQNIISREAVMFIRDFIINLPLFVFIFFAFDRKKLKIKIFLLLASLFYFILWGLVPTIEVRYLLPGLFGFAVLAGLGFRNCLNYNRLTRFFGLAFLILVILVNTAYGFLKVRSYAAYFFGQKTRAQFLTERIAPDWWSIYDYNGEIKKTIGNSYALVIGAWHLYYIDFPYEHASLSSINFRLINNVPDLAQKIKESGFDYVVAKRGDLLTQLVAFTSIETKGDKLSQVEAELKKYFPQVYEDKTMEIIIYRLK